MQFHPLTISPLEDKDAVSVTQEAGCVSEQICKARKTSSLRNSIHGTEGKGEYIITGKVSAKYM
jgi:hypothetical protein